MLELMIGTDYTAITDAILRAVAADVSAGQGNRIVLVPELISHDMERRLCVAAGDTVSRFAQVLSFTRLAQRISESAGCASPKCLDNGGRVVAMAAAARNLHSKLKAYAAVETRPEFLTQMVDAVDEFKRCCITPEDLKSASMRAEGALAQKLEELALLLETYDAVCQRGKRDPRDLMQWVLERLEDSDFAQERVFYIDGFPDFTRQNFAIIEHLIARSRKVIIGMNCDCVGSRMMAFEKAGTTASELVQCAHRWNVPVVITEVSSQNPQLNRVCQLLFQGTVSGDESLGGSVKVRRSDSVYQECQNVARDILSLVQGGSRYRDISIVCTDMTTYRPVLSQVFRRLNLPVYLSGTEDILNKGAIMTVLYGLEAALEGFEHKAVLRYLRSLLSPLDPDTCDLVENYAVVWGVSGLRWKRPWTEHPDGLSGKWDEDSRAKLERIENARIAALGPLIRLQEGFRSAVKMSAQVEALYRFLEDTQYAQRLEILADRFVSDGDDRSAQIMDQLWEILLNALEQMYDVLGDTVWDPEVFVRLLKLILSQYNVGTIPTVLDSLMAGPVSAMRCQRQKHLFVLGAEEGALPAYHSGDGLLTDQERVALRGLDVPLTGGALEGIQEGFAEVYGVFCGASQSITVSYASGQPSYVYRRLKSLVGMEEVCDASQPMNHPYDIACHLARNNRRDEATTLGVEQEYQDVVRRRNYELGKISRENVDKLYGKKLTLSASQVDRQAECRLSYFLKYGLRARERKEATVDPSEYGTYVHSVLEQTASEVMSLGGFHHVSREDTLKIAKKHSGNYAKEHFAALDSRRLDYLFQRNVQELDLVVQELWEELHGAEYLPLFFELHFGRDGALQPIRIDSPNMEAQLQGFVDRVDRFQVGDANYFRVVDYKTGSKDFDYCDVFNGVGLQMLLYLFTLEQEGQELLGNNPVPAGVQYFPARVPYVSIEGSEEDETGKRKKNWVRKGLLLEDDLSLAAMDADEDLSRLSCTRKKDGTLSGDLADRSQLRMLRRYVFMVLARMVDDIASGNVEANPYTRGSSHDACAYCPYDSVCHSDAIAGRRDYKAMSAQRFWDEVQKEVDTNG